ncbi:hypothetical protein ACFVXC_16675 [Streptomyces sp. NPDC058257]|uniref:hypothetical protein n=1 Tax=Streptomyces sp. NPDC058257 TaxID=3346409 RepID=UPI0036E840B6
MGSKRFDGGSRRPGARPGYENPRINTDETALFGLAAIQPLVFLIHLRIGRMSTVPDEESEVRRKEKTS